MASITPDWTGVTPQWMQTTQPMITSSFLDTTGLGWMSAVTTGGSASVITDVSRLQQPYASDRNWRGSYVRMISGTVANLGQVRQVQSFDQNAGAVAVSPAFPAVVAENDEYEMWNTTVYPQTVCNLLDRLVSQYGLGLVTYSVLSEVPDFDMEQSGTGAWVATDATIAKVAWAPEEPGIAGKQALSVATTGASGYASSRNIRVKGGNSLWLSALFTPDDPTVDNTGFLQLIDVATGTLIDEIRTSSKASVRLFRPVANSSLNTTLVAVRFGSAESGVTGHWDDIVLTDALAFDAPLPYWMGSEAAFKEAYIWRPLSGGQAANEYDPALIGHVAQGWRPFTDMYSNGGQLRLRGQAPAPFMMYVQGVRFESAWGPNILEAKRIDVPWAVAALALAYYQRLKGQTILDENQDAALAAQINWWRKEYEEHNNRVRSAARTQESPITSWVRI